VIAATRSADHGTRAQRYWSRLTLARSSVSPIAALGSIFVTKLSGSTHATLAAHYASALNELELITGLLALVASVCALVLIRPQDFIVHVPAPAGGQGSPVPATD
jgi:hypothetical protein